MTRPVRCVLRRRSPEPRGPDEATDRGLSLLEVLVSVVLLGLGGVATMVALGASVRGSSTHEEKVAALATLESAAAVLHEKVEPCSASAYLSVAEAAVTDPWWASSLSVTGVSCGSDIDELQLSVTSPRGLVQTLDVVVGGPRVADTPDGGDFDDTNLPIVSCAVTSLVADPVTKELSDIRLLTGDVRVEARTTAACSGSLRAVFTPAPVDPATGLEWRPSFQEIGERHYELILTEGTFAWETGPITARVENRLPDDSFVNLGTLPGLFTTTCRTTSNVSNPSPQLEVDGRLLEPLSITVELSPACTTPPSLTFNIETGSGNYIGTLVPSGTTWTGTIPGHAQDGPVFVPGTRTITIEAPFEIAPIPIQVQ